MEKKKFIMLVGLPASGKSHYADSYAHKNEGTYVVSSDKVRELLYGSCDVQGDPNEVFSIVSDIVKNRLRDDNIRTVIMDATNISKRRRLHFMKSVLHGFNNVEKECHWILRPYSGCVINDSARVKGVGEDVIRKMYTSFCPPHIHEGFDTIKIIPSNDIIVVNLYSDFLNTMMAYDQENSHHSLTLGEHMKKCHEILCSEKCDTDVVMAGMMHDCGKPFCATNINKKGELCEEIHYYDHEHVGSYDAALYLKRSDIDGSVFDDNFICQISNLIYYHMHPYMSWKQSEKSLKKDTAILGEDFVSKVMQLHEADVKTH